MTAVTFEEQISTGRSSSTGVLHLGLGGFHRAHQAMVFDALLRRGDPRWEVTAVGMRQTALADALAARGGRYPVLVADARGQTWHWVGAIRCTLVAAREPDAVVRTIADPSTRWVTLTVTEKGYGPELAALLVAGLRARHGAGHGGLTLASCDNLRDNGRVLCKLLLGAAEGEPALAAWIATDCAFPSSMVDRIVPAPTPEIQQRAHAALGPQADSALVTEGFWEWVIEDRFHDPSDAAALRRAGVTVAADVRPYEDAKLRLLNGSHSALAFLGVLAGWPTVDAFVADPIARGWLQRLMHEELGPGLQRTDWPDYAQALLQRFANPALGHRTQQIATDGSQKIPQRWVPVLEARLRSGEPVTHLALAAAAWIRLWQGPAEDGAAIAVGDPMGERLRTLASAHPQDLAAAVRAIGTLTEVWGPMLTRHEAWLSAVAAALQGLRAHGVRACLAASQA